MKVKAKVSFYHNKLGSVKKGATIELTKKEAKDLKNLIEVDGNSKVQNNNSGK